MATQWITGILYKNTQNLPRIFKINYEFNKIMQKFYLFLLRRKIFHN